jgi:hypothetical protein
MANYYATARSNYFAVKDETTFRQWTEFAGLKVLDPDHKDKSADGIRRFAIAPDTGDDAGWPDPATTRKPMSMTRSMSPVNSPPT